MNESINQNTLIIQQMEHIYIYASIYQSFSFFFSSLSIYDLFIDGTVAYPQ